MATEGEGDILLHGHGIEEGGHLEAHANRLPDFEEFLSTQLRNDLALDGDMPFIGGEETHDVAEQNRFSGSRSPQDHEAFALLDLEVHIGEHHFGAEGLGKVDDINDGPCLAHRPTSISLVRKKSATRIHRELVTTLLVGASPTPSAPPRVR